MKQVNTRLRNFYKAIFISVILTFFSLTVSSFIHPNSGINTSPGCINFCPVTPLTFSKLSGHYGPLGRVLLSEVLLQLFVLSIFGLPVLSYIMQPQKKNNGVINLITKVLYIAVMGFGLYAYVYFLINIFIF